jgi:hypothetical protein
VGKAVGIKLGTSCGTGAKQVRFDGSRVAG